MKYNSKVVSYGLSLLTATVALIGAAGPLQAQEKKPNILVIMGDDIGMWNIGAYHRGLMAGRTPNLERLVDFWRQAGGLAAGNEKLLAEIVWPHFWAIQIILFVLIVMYCTMHELVRVIGRKKVLRIFFGPMPIPQV
jgi:hypothetical protein